MVQLLSHMLIFKANGKGSVVSVEGAEGGGLSRSDPGPEESCRSVLSQP